MSNTDTFFNLPKQVLKVLPNTLAVAWSGGADSTALLHYFKAEGYAVSAWHIDHGWSVLSAKQAVSLAQRAEAWGIPFYYKTLQKPKQNIEAESRQLRYAAFSDLADETQCFNLVLGHHLEDQAETVCMRLLQGAGVAGCQGIRRVRKQGNLFLHRPFLHIKKAKIKQYLHEQDIDWLEDPSNQDVRIWRNKIRHQLFPMMQSQGVDPVALFLRYQKQAIKVQHNIEMLAGNHL
ncbi:MAG: tRNA lysidine(34) synthetase TilS, partial [Ghiorsea sp.]|nr:tRNA lysidine(34) synthetase TilS [Ghiorsea sp.]